MDLSMILSPALKAETPERAIEQPQQDVDDAMSRLDLLVQADAIIKQSCPNDEVKPQYLRSGVWSRAEEQYAAALVTFFLEGTLQLPEGTTLRKFLAEELCCNRRRVSMKLGTEALAGHKVPRKAGSTVFVAAEPPPTDEERRQIEAELEQLRQASFNSTALEDERPSRLKTNVEKRVALRPRRKSAVYSHTHQEERPKRGKPTIIRTGFESAEEEEFVTTMVEFFLAGALDLPKGMKLVMYLCQHLGCTPKVLSMKLAPRYMGEDQFPENIGSITYQRNNLDDDDFLEELFEVESRLIELRTAYEEAHMNAPPPLVVHMKRKRKISMASVDSIGTASVDSVSSSPIRPYQHSGPWSHDEEVFMAALIDCFFKGVLDVAVGTTLRSFLSARLCCNPMRISKKLSCESIAEIRIPKKLGSSTYVRRTELTPEEERAAENSLHTLRTAHLMTSSKKGKWGFKRQRTSRNEGPRFYPQVATLDTDSDSDEQSVASTYAFGKNLQKLQKAAKANAFTQDTRQHFPVPHTGPKLHKLIPASLEQSSAYGF